MPVVIYRNNLTFYKRKSKLSQYETFHFSLGTFNNWPSLGFTFDASCHSIRTHAINIPYISGLSITLFYKTKFFIYFPDNCVCLRDCDNNTTMIGLDAFFLRARPFPRSECDIRLYHSIDCRVTVPVGAECKLVCASTAPFTRSIWAFEADLKSNTAHWLERQVIAAKFDFLLLLARSALSRRAYTTRRGRIK